MTVLEARKVELLRVGWNAGLVGMDVGVGMDRCTLYTAPMSLVSKLDTELESESNTSPNSDSKGISRALMKKIKKSADANATGEGEELQTQAVRLFHKLKCEIIYNKTLIQIK